MSGTEEKAAMMETKQVERQAEAGGPKWGSPAPHRATMASRRGFGGSGWFAGGRCAPQAAAGAATAGTQNRKNSPASQPQPEQHAPGCCAAGSVTVRGLLGRRGHAQVRRQLAHARLHAVHALHDATTAGTAGEWGVWAAGLGCAARSVAGEVLPGRQASCHCTLLLRATKQMER